MAKKILSVECVLCGKHYDFEDVLFTCPACGDEGIVDVQYDYQALTTELREHPLHENRDFSIWRYLPFLPLRSAELAPRLQVGWTPLYQRSDLARELGIGDLLIKDDGRQPTGSLKDRASAIGLVRARELGQTTICAASTGNAASSLAGLAASVGIHPIIFVPKTAPRGKIAQLMIFGARVLAVNGTYDDAFDLSLEAAREFGWYTRSTAVNPVLSEGKKTVAFEICEQLAWLDAGANPGAAVWRAPDVIAVSVGDGCIIGGIGKGLRDLQEVGLIDRMPRILGVQAEGSSVIAAAFHAGSEMVTPVSTSTVADSICVDKPRDAVKALRSVRASQGTFVTVSDESILQAQKVLGRRCGVFAEPAGATAYAGVCRAIEQGFVRPSDRVAVVVSGNGLKDVDSAMRSTGQPQIIDPTLSALTAVIDNFQGA